MHTITFETEAEAMAEYRRLVVVGTYAHISMRYNEDWGAYIVSARPKGVQ